MFISFNDTPLCNKYYVILNTTLNSVVMCNPDAMLKSKWRLPLWKKQYIILEAMCIIIRLHVVTTWKDWSRIVSKLCKQHWLTNKWLELEKNLITHEPGLQFFITQNYTPNKVTSKFGNFSLYMIGKKNMITLLLFQKILLKQDVQHKLGVRAF